MSDRMRIAILIYAMVQGVVFGAGVVLRGPTRSFEL